MSKTEIIEAWARIRKIDNTIPDDVLDFMKDASIAAIDNAAQLAPVWVKVSESLPELGEKVLYLRNGNILIGRLNSNGWSLFFSDGEGLINEEMPIEAWQPLPTQPTP